MVINIAISAIIFIVATGALTFVAIHQANRLLPPAVNSIVQLTASLSTMLFTYYLLLWFVSLASLRVTENWNHWATYAPRSNSWQHQLIDFLSRDFHQSVFAFSIIGVSVILLVAGILRHRSLEALPKLFWLFAGANLLYIFSFIAWVLLTWWSTVRSGHQQVWLDTLITIALLAIIFGFQTWISFGVERSYTSG